VAFARVIVEASSTEPIVFEVFCKPVKVSVPLEQGWERLSPGKIPFTVKIGSRSQRSAAVCWTGMNCPASYRFLQVDLKGFHNAEFQSLFSPKTQWRIDYSGSQHGVEWRRPLPAADRYGYVLLNSVMSVFEYGTLPEQWPPEKRWVVPSCPEGLLTNIGISFSTGGCRLLALSATEPWNRFPSSVRITLPEPKRLEKVYLLPPVLQRR
jgi:hypothetical protein